MSAKSQHKHPNEIVKEEAKKKRGEYGPLPGQQH